MTGYNVSTGGTPKRNWKGLLYAAAPALLYTALSNAVHSLCAASGLFASGASPRLLMQAVSVFVCLLFFGWYAYREGIRLRSGKKGIYRYPASFCYVMAVVMCGIVNNYLFSIIMSFVRELSSGYWQVVQAFYNQSLGLEILTLCVLAPLAEELVYRGMAYHRFLKQFGEPKAAVLSALLFGVMHLNLVQGIYAFVLGILLAHIVYQTGSLLAAVAAHMAANLVSVLWTETDWLDVLNQSGGRQYAAVVACLVLMGIFLAYGNRMIKREGEA